MNRLVRPKLKNEIPHHPTIPCSQRNLINHVSHRIPLLLIRSHFHIFTKPETKNSSPSSTKIARRRLNHGQKLAILRDADRRDEQGESLSSIARSHKVQAVQIRKWRRQRNALVEATKSKKALCKGRTSTIKHLEDEVIGWALELRDDDLGFGYKHVQVRACQADDDFLQKNERQQYQEI